RNCLRASVSFFFQAEDGIRDFHVTGVQTCALPISEALGSTQQVAFPKLVYKLYYDAATQVAWLCSEDRGLGKLTIPGDDLHFRGLPQWTTEGDNQEVRSMLVDSRQRLWMGTKSGELFISESGKMVEPVLRGRPTGGF